MSQQITMRKRQRLFYNELNFGTKKPQLKTTVLQTNCRVCGKGLEAGFSLTAKTTRSGTLFFCDSHYPRSVIVSKN
ncbi:MAG: hypothetical protein WD154_02225 [Nitrosopumilaceae archaeon]